MSQYYTAIQPANQTNMISESYVLADHQQTTASGAGPVPVLVPAPRLSQPGPTPTLAGHYLSTSTQPDMSYSSSSQQQELVIPSSPGFSTPQQQLIPKSPGGDHISSGLYTATYSGVPVFELMVNGVAVMRRRHDSSLNATQILKVAGIEKSKRTKVLEREILTGTHEKVQGGYGKYQGTWIPFDRAISLCKQYEVYDALCPLLEFDIENNGMENTPTKEQVMAAKRKRTLTTTSNAASTASTSSTPPLLPSQQSLQSSFTQPLLQVSGSSSVPLSTNANSALTYLKGQQEDTDEDEDVHNDKKMKVMDEVEEILSEEEEESIALDPLNDDNDKGHFEQSRELITQIFLDDQKLTSSNLEQLLTGIIIDVPIDDLGHTALHWAAALARIPLVKQLVKQAANRLRVNYAGETALVRAVLVTNSSDLSLFPELLDILYPAIMVFDKQRRTVLHHIALTAGIKGRSDASKYYLESLLEWIVKRGKSKKSGKFGLGRFMNEIVNAQDKNGDTALNIAARVGNKNIVQQLLEVGADPTIPNRAGLKPVDFGVQIFDNKQQIHQNATTGTNPANNNNNNNNNNTNNNTYNNSFYVDGDRRKEIIKSMNDKLHTLESDFEQELRAKQRLIDSMHQQLREATTKLTQNREKLDYIKSVSNKIIQFQRSTQNLDKAVLQEKDKFSKTTSPSADDNSDVEYDPDQPFRIQSNESIPPLLILKARLLAYRRNTSNLKNLISDLNTKSSQLQSKFRKVVALCTGINDENQVDELLDGLVEAVESDPPGEVDIARVAGFLRRVDKQ